MLWVVWHSEAIRVLDVFMCSLMGISDLSILDWFNSSIEQVPLLVFSIVEAVIVASKLYYRSFDLNDYIAKTQYSNTPRYAVS